MGVRNSTRRRRMEDRETGEGEGGPSASGDADPAGRVQGQGQGQSQGGQGQGGQGQEEDEWQHDHNRDLATVLSYLIRSGQVSILTSGGGGIPEDDEEYYEDDPDWEPSTSSPRLDRTPDTSVIESSEFTQEVLQQSGLCLSEKCDISASVYKPDISGLLRKREIGMRSHQGFSGGDCNWISSSYLPNKSEKVASYHQKAFCGTYSKDGNIFLSACQDQNIRIYDTRFGGFRLFKTVRARDVGWSVLDTAFSPDGNHLIYSSWSDSIHLSNIYGEQDSHSTLPLCPDVSRTAIFSLTFSSSGSEILGGANDGCLYIYSLEENQRILKIDAHEDDVNAVAFADATSQILFSGGDDGLVKVWDRRTLNEEAPEPVGILAGHADGITFLDSKGDARYLISNCKDQTIKLWDMRKFSTSDAQVATKREVARQNWDYRWQQAPRRVAAKRAKLPGDTSLMTYRGHSVLHTLVRARFSPSFTTGQRYIYTGSATGAVIIYDALSGNLVSKLRNHRACVRDVSWHPYEHKIMSTSWDGTIAQWRYVYEETDSDMDTSSEDDSDAEDDTVRRSKRLRDRRRRRFRLGNL